MATIKGRGIVWSIGGVTFTGGVSTGTLLTQKLDHTMGADTQEIKDSNGDVVAKVFYNHKRTLSATVIPAAASGTNTVAAAVTAATAWLPSLGTPVTMVDAIGAATGTLVGYTATAPTVYIVTSSKLSRTVDGAASIDLELEQFMANDISATIS